MQNDVKAWRDRIQIAKDERRPHEIIWRKLWREIAGRNFADKFLADEHGQPANLHNNYIRVLMPHLVPRGRDLKIEVSAKRDGAEFEMAAEQLGDQINAILPQVRWQDELRRATRVGLSSCGILKHGLNFRTGAVIETPSHKDPSQTAMYDVDLELAGHKEYLDPDLPWSCQVHPCRFYNDPWATNLQEARWVSHEIYRPIEVMKADPRFREVAHLLEPNARTIKRPLREGGGLGEGDHQGDPKLELFCYHEAYDRDCRAVYCIDPTGKVDVVLATLPWPDGVEGFPFSMLVFEEVQEYFWPNPPLSPQFDGRVSVDVLMEAAIKAAKSAKNVVLYDSDEIKADQIKKLAEAEDQDVIGIPGLKKGVEQARFGGMHPDMLKGAEAMKALTDEMAGVAEFHRGVPGSGSTTATEIQASYNMSGVQLDDMRGCVLDFAQDAISKFAGLYLAHSGAFEGMQLPLETRLIALGPGTVGEVADFLFSIVPSSVERVDPAIKQKRTQDLIQISTNPNIAMKLQAENSQFKLKPLLERHLREIGELNPEKYLVDIQLAAGGGEDPEAAAKAQQEDAEMLRGGEPLPVDPADDHQTHLQFHEMTAQQTGSEVIAMHVMEHHQYLAAAVQPGGLPQQGPAAAPPGGPPMPAPNQGGGAAQTPRQEVGQLRREAGRLTAGWPGR
jgi:hypothetical protein